MDWELIIKHQLCGSVPVFAALAVFFGITNKRRVLPPGHFLALLVLCFYLVGVLNLAGIWFLGRFEPRIVFVPFADMVRSPLYTALNVLLFVPLGLFLPILYKDFDRVGKVAAVGFLLSLSIELLQMFGCGTSDVNDLITDTLGACLGCALSKLLCGSLPQSWVEVIRAAGARGCREVLLFWIAALFIMVTIQPRLYHLLFTAGAAGEISIWK